MSSDTTFYERIEPFHHITDIMQADYYQAVPDDWYIALTDVQGSTIAIEQGRYREVNSIAAASIAGLLNQMPDIDLPFVFGGDGATILLPPTVYDDARQALAATRQLARDAFDLTLRVGIVPVRDVYRAGYAIRVARLQMSDNFQQAVFMGGGLAYAEKLVKDPALQAPYLVPDMPDAQADFTRFECRWREVPSAHQETISLLVMATGAPETQATIYSEVLQAIERIYGDSGQRHPLRVRNLHLRLLPSEFKIEGKIRYRDISWQRLWQLTKATFKARIAMWFNILNWGAYKHLLVETTDHEKFDDTLRMIISGTAQQRDQLRAYLQTQHATGALVYGIHRSRGALVTCVVYDYFGRQVHFVDGAQGGYALAAKEMKAQLAAQQVKA